MFFKSFMQTTVICKDMRMVAVLPVKNKKICTGRQKFAGFFRIEG